MGQAQAQGQGQGQWKCVAAESWNDDKKKLFRRQFARPPSINPPSSRRREPYLFNNFLQFYCLHLCWNSHMSSVYPIFGQKFFLAWSFVISNSKLGPAHVRRTFAPFYTHFWTSFFAHNLHANLPLSVERPTSSTAPSFPHLGCACLFLFPARLQAATWPSFWPSSRAPAHSSSHLFARFFFFFAARRLLVHFLCPVNNFCSVYFSRVGRRQRRLWKFNCCCMSFCDASSALILLPPATATSCMSCCSCCSLRCVNCTPHVFTPAAAQERRSWSRRRSTRMELGPGANEGPGGTKLTSRGLRCLTHMHICLSQRAQQWPLL